MAEALNEDRPGWYDPQKGNALVQKSRINLNCATLYLCGRTSSMKSYSLYLNGEWVAPGGSLPVLTPAPGETFARISTASRDRVAQAIQDAHAAFGSWRQTTGKLRGEFLQKIANEVERRRDDIARMMTMENGKPLAQSNAEITMSIDHLRWFGEQ